MTGDRDTENARPQDFADCAVCGGLIGWIDCPTGGWWRHATHPDDNHAAVASDRVTSPHSQEEP